MWTPNFCKTKTTFHGETKHVSQGVTLVGCQMDKLDVLGVHIVCTHSRDLSGRGAARAEGAQGTPIKRLVSPSILVYEKKIECSGVCRGNDGLGVFDRVARHDSFSLLETSHQHHRNPHVDDQFDLGEYLC